MLVSLHSIVAAITCPMVPTVANAKATGADVRLGAAVWYTCKVKNLDMCSADEQTKEVHFYPKHIYNYTMTNVLPLWFLKQFHLGEEVLSFNQLL